VKVNVAANAPSSVTNRVSVNGGGSAGANADDPTSIGTNSSDLALGKAATQSSTASFSIVGAAGAVDGNTDGNYSDGSVTHTNYDPNAWWQLDLGASATVNSIVIWNRTDGGLGYRLNDYWVFVSNTPFTPSDTPSTLQSRAGTWSSHQTVAPNPSTSITVPGYQGRYVRLQLSGTNYLSLAEVQVFGM
jgi:alpha-L-fucosidase 2